MRVKLNHNHFVGYWVIPWRYHYNNPRNNLSLTFKT